PVPCLALRVTYVGELGWELYCPTEFGLALWDTLWEAGRGHGLAAGGYKAIDSLRLEKGYRVWGADITPDDTPYEAGLGFAVELLVRALADRALEPLARREHVPAAEEEEGRADGQDRVVEEVPVEPLVPRYACVCERKHEHDADERDPEDGEPVDPLVVLAEV